MARSAHRRWKGCCIMCGFHTLRGNGPAYRDAFSAQRRLGVKRRYGRTEVTRLAEWLAEVDDENE